MAKKKRSLSKTPPPEMNHGKSRHSSKKKSGIKKREKEKSPVKTPNRVHQRLLKRTFELTKSSCNLAKYHEGKTPKDADKSDPDSTLGTISSADERDM